MNKVWETKQKQAWPLSLSHVNGRMHGPSWSLKILAIKDCPPAAVSMGPSLNDSPFWNFCEVLCTASPCIGNIKPLVHEPPWVLFYHQTANLVNYNNPEEKLGGSSSGRGWSNIALEIICSDVQNAFFFFLFLNSQGILSNREKVKSFSCVRLFCDPVDCSLPGVSVHGIFQAKYSPEKGMSQSQWVKTWP